MEEGESSGNREMEEKKAKRLRELCIGMTHNIDKRIEEVRTILEEYPNVINMTDKHKKTPLHLTAIHHQPEVMSVLLANGADAELQDDEEYTPLMYSIKKQSVHCFEILMDRPVNVNTSLSNGLSPLHIAVEQHCDNGRAVKRLLDNGADINRVDRAESLTPLHIAARYGCDPVLKELLKGNFTDINRPDKGKHSPLHLAAGNGHRDCCESLIEAGAECSVKDKQGETPLMIAVKNGYEKTCEVLLCGNKATINDANNLGKTPLILAASSKKASSTKVLELLLKFKPDLTATTSNGDTSLHYAVKGGYAKNCKLLIQHGADCNAIDKQGMTPLHYAAKKDLHDCVAAILRLPSDDISDSSLCEFEAENDSDEMDFNVDVNIKDQRGMAPIHYALDKGSQRCCELLLKRRVNVNLETNDNRTPLHLAASKGLDECCRRILLKGTNANAKDNEGKTALHLAAIAKSRSCCQILVKKASKLDILDEADFTPLHYASQSGSVECCRYLLGTGRNSSYYSNDITPLHLAAQGGFIDCCRELVSNEHMKTQLLRRNKKGQMPHNIAFDNKHDDVFCFLLQSAVEYIDSMRKNLLSSTVRTVPPKPMFSRVAGQSNEKKCHHAKPGQNSRSHPKKFGNYCARGKLTKEENYIRSALSELLPKCIEERRRKSAEAIMRCSKWKEALITEKDRSFTANFCLLIKHYPDLAKIVLDNSMETLSSGEKIYSFQFLENSFFLPERLEEPDAVLSFRSASRTIMIIQGAFKGSLSAMNASVGWPCRLVQWLASFFLEQVFKDTDDDHEAHTEPEDEVERGSPFHNAVVEKVVAIIRTVTRRSSTIRAIGRWSCHLLQRSATFFLEKVIYPSDFRDTDHDALKEQTESDPVWSPYESSGNLKAEAIERTFSEDTRNENIPLLAMVKYERLDLLEHEVCERFLKYKWERYVGKIYGSLFFISAAFAGFLSFYVTVAYDWVYINQVHNLTRESICEPICANNPSLSSDFATTTTTTTATATSGPTLSQITDSACYRDDVPEIIQDGMTTQGRVRILTMLLLVISVIVEVIKICKIDGRKKNWKSIGLVVACYFSAFILLFNWTECSETTGIREEWQWVCGVASVLMAWFELVLLLGKVPGFGLYLFMLNDFMVTMLKLAIFLLLQVVAFSVAFQMLLRNRFVFSNYPRTTMKILTMTLGDLNYEDHFSNEESPLHYPLISHLLLICFLGLISVIMLNFVSNFSQDELDKARKQTRFVTLKHCVNMTLDMESMSPPLSRRYTRERIKDCNLDTQSNSGNSVDKEINEEKTSCHCINSLSKIKTQIEDLSSQISDLKSVIREAKYK